MKNLKIIILFLSIALLFSAGSSAFALEAKYPVIPGLPPVTDDSDLRDYVGYFFGLSMYIAGILAVISFTVGAIQIIASASNPEIQNQGKDRMKGSILGLVLTLSAFIILQTINPKLVTPSLTPLPGVAGIFYSKGNIDDLKPAPLSEPNISASETIKKGYDQIYYKCNEGQEEMAPTLLIWKFPEPNLKGSDENYSGVTMARKRCGEMESIGGAGSFKMNFETPGIYYFLGEDCAGFMSEANTTTQDKISEPFTAKIKSIKIVNDPNAYKYYGAIFHNNVNAANSSDCTSPMLVFADSSGFGKACLNISEFSFPGFGAYSVEIFQQGRDLTSSSGDGVWFFSNVNGWDSGNKSGVSYISSEQIGNYFLQDAAMLMFNYTGVPTDLANICKTNPSCRVEGANPNNCCFCSSPKDWSSISTSIDEEKGCGGSIRFGGNGYLVTLYTLYQDLNGNNRQYCQSFKKDTPNLSSQGSFLPFGGAELNFINIIPIH